MAWNDTTCKEYDCKINRYPSDTSDGQWANIEPLVPLPKHRGRPRNTNMREVVNFLRRTHRMSMACAAERFSTSDNCSAVFLFMGQDRCVDQNE